MLRDTAERGGLTLSLLLSVFSTPPSLRATSPIFCITKHRGGVWLYSLQTCRGLFCFTPPSPYGHSPYISSKTPRNVTGHGRERVVTTVAGFFNPSVTSCHLLYILHYKTQGRRTEMSRNAIEYEREGGAPLFLTALFLAELV